jgi:plastocyanin
MIESLKGYLVLVIVITSSAGALDLTLLTTASTTTMNVYGQAGTGVQNIKATYAVEIVPGAAQKTNLIHYYPPAIAVPVGTTVGWFNNDPEQPHTVTSGLPGASDSGALFNSGVMPATAGSFFQYTFDRAGDFAYHCEIHPWRVGIVSVSDATEKGINFVLASGVGPTWNVTKDFRTLLDFTPVTAPAPQSPVITYNITTFKSNPANNLYSKINVPLDGSTPLTYNISMFKDSLAKSVFSKTFVVSGAPLPLELMSGGYVNQTRAYGPDFSSSGAYHLEAPFLKGNANYTIKVEIAAINGKQPQNKITDDFSLKTVT